MAPVPLHAHGTTAPLTWRPTKVMNMRDLSNDDDFISHILVEKLGTGAVPLYVHKMDSGRRLPKTDPQELLQIVRRLVLCKGTVQNAVRQATDDILKLPALRYYLKSYTQKQINAFATHASRYFELYYPSGSIEIAHTSRYAHKTGKSELCILATRTLAPGTVITELKGSMANLTDEEDKELKRAGMRNSDIRRDFSVIHSKSMKKNHLFLGPARFVNHDCNNNCELFREGRYITFRVLRPINIGEEITAHYGDGYFGRKNRHCLCETCEKNGRGGYAPDHDEDDTSSSSSSSNSDSESDSEMPSDSDSKAPLNVNERRTRRRVYAIVTREEDSDESESEEDNKVPLAGAEDIPADGDIELTTEADTPSELTSLTPSVPPNASDTRDPLTPNPPELPARFSSSLSSLSSAGESTPRRDSSTPFRSIISTRRQKAHDTEADSSKPDDKSSQEQSSLATPAKRLTRSASAIFSMEKAKESTPIPLSGTPRRGRPSKTTKEAVQVKKEEVDARVLRARPAPPPSAEPSKVPAKSDAPRGADGKPLPTCATCGNVLPVISVDSKVVWGLGFESGKKKKKHDCPRCLRHFAIYKQPWPRRVPPHGTAFSVTPREEFTFREESTSLDLNKRVTQKTLPVLDRKLAAAASARKRPRKEDASEEEPAAKRRKTDSASLVLKLKQPHTNTTKSSASANTTPAACKVPPSKEPVRSKSAQTSPCDSPETMKRKRGRPRLSDKLLSTTVPIVKTEETATQIPDKFALSQPRNMNGRFGRKDTILKAQQRAARAAVTTTVGGQGSPRKEKVEPPKPTRSSPRKKRENDDPVDSDEFPKKRKASLEMDRDVGDIPPLQRVVPRRTSTFKGATLVSNPNPLSFALQVWASPLLRDDSSSSSEDEQGVDTPEDHLSPPAPSIVDPEQDDHQDLPLTSPALPRGALTYKPSPFTFAKRRWASASGSPGLGSSLDDDNKKKESDPLVMGRRVQSMYTPGHRLAGDEVNSDATSTPQSPASDTFSYPSGVFSDDEAAMDVVQIYPVVPKPHHHQFIHKPMQYCSQAYADASKPSFIHAGWDDARSEASDA